MSFTDPQTLNTIKKAGLRNEYWFVEDLIDGACLVACMCCGHNFRSGTLMDGEYSSVYEECPSCHELLRYPEGASW